MPFLTETAFYAKLAGRFSGFKTKVTYLIASKFGKNISLINLKLLSKNGRVKAKEQVTRASVVPTSTDEHFKVSTRNHKSFNCE